MAIAGWSGHGDVDAASEHLSRRTVTNRFSWAASGLAALALLVYLHFTFLPSTADSSLCITRRALHLSCPGCGLTRAFGALAHGDLLLAFRFHPLGPLFFLEGAALWLGWGLVLRGKIQQPPNRSIDAFLFIQLFLLLFVWIIRFATGTLPA